MKRPARRALPAPVFDVLRVLHEAGGSAEPPALLAASRGSWAYLVGILSTLEDRDLVVVRTGRVLLTRHGVRLASRRFAH